MQVKSEYSISTHDGKTTLKVFTSLDEAEKFYNELEDKDAYQIFEIIWQSMDDSWSIVNVFPVGEEEIY